MDAPGRFHILISYGQLKHLHACVLVRHDQHEGGLNVGVVGGEHHAHRTSHPVFLLTALVHLCLPAVSILPASSSFWMVRGASLL